MEARRLAVDEAMKTTTRRWRVPSASGYGLRVCADYRRHEQTPKVINTLYSEHGCKHESWRAAGIYHVRLHAGFRDRALLAQVWMSRSGKEAQEYTWQT